MYFSINYMYLSINYTLLLDYHQNTIVLDLHMYYIDYLIIITFSYFIINT